MKRLYFILMLLAGLMLNAQVPQKINYQALARNSAGAVVSNQLVGIKFTIRSGGFSGTVVYEDTTFKSTNQFGLFTAQIGGGGVVSGSFSTIPWGNGNIFLEVSIDPAGGTNYISVSNTQFVSVPYAMYAQYAANGTAGPQGSSITWLGSFSSPPSPSDTLDAYYNTTAGVSFIWNGFAWDTIAKNGISGTNGLSINWLGNLSNAPATANALDAYYNIQNGLAFIYNGATNAWDTLSKNGLNGSNGINGANGLNGVNGQSVEWLGHLAAPPATPDTLQAYYNITQGVSFIYNATTASWDTLAKNGPPGAFNLGGSSFQTLFHNGTTWVPANNLLNNGNGVAINTTSMTAGLNIGDNFSGSPELEFTDNTVNEINALGNVAFNTALGMDILVAASPKLSVKGNGIGINTTSPAANAILDVDAPGMGVLIPRMQQSVRTAIAAPPQGLLVYQTDGLPGFYYFDGTWNYLSPGSGWSLNGNNISGSEFIGTTNSADLIFKTANIQNMLLTTGGKLGLGANVSPTENLQVEGGVSPTFVLLGSASPQIGFGTSASHFLGGIGYDLVTGTMNFKTSGSPTMKLAGTGDLGLGITANPSVNSLELGPNKSLLFEGVTDNAFETRLTVADPTASNTLTLPNMSGLVLADPSPAPGDLVYLNAAASPTNLAIGTNGQVLTVNAGVPSWTTLGASALAPNSLDYTEFKNAMTLDAALNVSQGAFGITHSFTGITNAFLLSANAVGSATGVQYMFNGLSSGKGLMVQSSSGGLTGSLVSFEANAAAGNTATGNVLNVTSALGGANNAALNITHTGTATSDYGLRVSNSGSGSINIGAEFSASGATNNYALVVPTGLAGFGTNSPSYPVHVSSAAVSPFQIDGSNATGMAATLNSTVSAPVSLNFSAAGITKARQFMVPVNGNWILEVGANQHIVVTPSSKMGVGYSAPSSTFGVGNFTNGEKLTIAGADGDLSFLDSQGSIIFPSNSAVGTPPMINMFSGAGPHQPRMVIGHSLGSPLLGLSFDDSKDAFHFQSPADTTLSVDVNNRKIRYKDGFQNEGKVLISDPVGVATWRPGSYFAASPLAGMGVGVPVTAPVSLGTAYTYVKNEQSTYLEIEIQGHVAFTSGTGTYANYFIYVDGQPAPNGTGVISIHYADAGKVLPVNIKGIFPNIPAGARTIELYVSGTGGSVVDPKFNPDAAPGGGSITIKELR